MARSGLFFAALVVALTLLFHPPWVLANQCGTYGTLGHAKNTAEYSIPGTNKINLVTECQRACKLAKEGCKSFAVQIEKGYCSIFGKLIENQGEFVAEHLNTVHFDRTCFDDRPTSSSTKNVQNLTNKHDRYTCIPQIGQSIYNPSFEDGIWVGYAHGWTLHGSTEENKPTRESLPGRSLEGKVNMVFEVIGTGSSSVSQTLCVVPGFKYELSAYIGHISAKNMLGQHQIYYHAPTLSVYLDRDLVFRNSVCGSSNKVRTTQCQPSDGSYYPINVIIKPTRATPNLTFKFDFDAPPGKRSYKGLLDLVQLYSVEPAVGATDESQGQGKSKVRRWRN